MNMYLHELKTYRKSTIIWIISLIGITTLFMSMFSSFSKDAAVIQKIFENFPEEIRKAFGISSLDLSSLLGYYGFMFSYVILFGAVQSMNLGLSIASAEIRQKTADFLLAKPITRIQIITSKLLAALTCIIITNIAYLAAAFIIMEAVKLESYSIKLFFMVSLILFLLQFIFLTLGLFISTAAKKIKSVLPISLGVVFGFYILNLLSSAIGDNKIRYITPFQYFDTAYILKNAAYETPFIVITLILIIAAITGSYLLYSKKDINAF